MRQYWIESADFMINKYTYKGEQITGLHELNGKIYLFTPNHTYVVRNLRWFESLWARLTRTERK